MQLELANYDRSATFNDLSRTVFVATQHSFNSVALPAHFIPEASSLNSQLQIISPIDFPFGLECTNVRLNAINEAVKRGSKIVELTLNTSYIYDQKYKAITEDINHCRILCNAKDIELRAMVEYRMFESKDLIDLSRKLYTAGIRHLTISTGTMMDDPVDNLIIAKEITKNTKIKTIANSCFCTTEHREMAEKSHLYGIRYNSTVVVEKLFKDSKNGV